MRAYLMPLNWGLGNVGTTTMKTYSEDEYRKIIGDLT